MVFSFLEEMLDCVFNATAQGGCNHTVSTYMEDLVKAHYKGRMDVWDCRFGEFTTNLLGINYMYRRYYTLKAMDDGRPKN